MQKFIIHTFFDYKYVSAGRTSRASLQSGGANLYVFSARTYAPDIARFLQPDPNASDYHWLSPYAYCGGDPINRVDPDGKDAIILFDGKTFTVFALLLIFVYSRQFSYLWPLVPFGMRCKDIEYSSIFKIF